MPKITKKSASVASSIKSQKSVKKVKVPHLVIEARAGTGKTTTLIEGLKKLRGVKSDHPAAKNPSPEQKAIYDALLLSKGAESVNFVAFNTSIANELKSRVPVGCDAMTSHSFGFRAVKNFFGQVKVENGRCQDLIARIMQEDIWALRKSRMVFMRGVENLVELCKMNLINGDNPEDLDKLVDHYQVDLERYTEEVYEMVPKVIELSADVAQDRQIQFIDMIWLPVYLNMPVPKYDLLLVDEAQDLNRCQQELVRRSGNRIVLCGDPKQAIYGFAGADSESMPRMIASLSETENGCEVLPLKFTRRCGKVIVNEANKIVPDFFAFETNEPGSVSYMALEPNSENGYYGYVEKGDMVLCRVNAPLVSECFRFIKAGVKARIQGRDIGAGLIKIVKDIAKRSPHDDMNVAQLIGALDGWRRDEEQKEINKRHPSESRLQNIADRYSCLMTFCENHRPEESHQAVIGRIDTLFSDESVEAVRFSSVHRAKGLEADRVFILLPDGAGMPHPLAKTDWEREQEYNLLYVAITRARNELIFVHGEKKGDNAKASQKDSDY